MITTNATSLRKNLFGYLDAAAVNDDRIPLQPRTETLSLSAKNIYGIWRKPVTFTGSPG